MLGYVYSTVLKLGDRYRDVLIYPIGKSEVSFVPILLRVIPALRLISSSQHPSGIGWRMLLVGLCRHFVFVVKLFRVRFDLPGLTLYYLSPWQNVPSTVSLLSFSLSR